MVWAADPPAKLTLTSQHRGAPGRIANMCPMISVFTKKIMRDVTHTLGPHNPFDRLCAPRLGVA